MSKLSKKVLVAVGFGTYSNIAPLIELARILSSRGFVIDFAIFVGREPWLKDCSFISEQHILGPAVPTDVEHAFYSNLSTSWQGGSLSWKTAFETKRFIDSFWPEAYRRLSQLARDTKTRPDFILADYMVDAARDVSAEHDIPCALLWPQMPIAMLPAPYIPGLTGFNEEIVTAEYASFWQRLRSIFGSIGAVPHALGYGYSVRKMRKASAVTSALRQGPYFTKPEYLCLVNSFFGLEAARDIPPNVSLVGPILQDTIPQLTEPYVEFLSGRNRVLYVAFGTSMIPLGTMVTRILVSILSSLRSGTIDGVIWPIPISARQEVEMTVGQEMLGTGSMAALTGPPWRTMMSVSDVLANRLPAIMVVDHAPQRALLHDKRVVSFLSHAGRSSTNEAVYSGNPIIALPFCFDQVQNTLGLRDAGVAIPLCQDTFTAGELMAAIKHVLEDKERMGPISRNIQRLSRIAQITSRRKYLAVDLIEEVLVDWEVRRQGRGLAERPGHMHLQTADVRMPWWKIHNYDIWVFVGGLATVAVVAITVGAICASRNANV